MGFYKYFPKKISHKSTWAIIAIFLLAVVVRLGIFVSTDFIFDDAYIYAKIAKNFSDGLGLVYNVGENIQTNTSLLFSLALGLLWKIIGEVSIDAMRVIGAFADAIAALGIVLLLSGKYKETDDTEKQIPLLALAAGTAYAIVPTVAIPAVGGMDTPFFMLTIIALFLALRYERFNLAIILSVVSVFMRPDGIIAAAVAFFYILFKQKKISPHQLLIIIGGSVLYGVILLTNYGTLIPQTVVAKSLSKKPAIDVWLDFLNRFYVSWLVLLPGFLSVVGIYRVFRYLKDLVPIFIYGLVYALLIMSFSWWWPWYLPPFIVVYLISIFIGIEYIALRFNSKKIQAVFVRVVFGVILVGLTIKSYSSIGALYKQPWTEWKKETAAVSAWVRSNIPHDETGMLEPAGLYGLLLPHRIDDYPGLASRRVTDALKDYKDIGGKLNYSFDAFAYAISVVRPDFIILRESEYVKFIETATNDLYDTRYSCCSELNTRDGPYFVLTRNNRSFSSGNGAE